MFFWQMMLLVLNQTSGPARGGGVQGYCNIRYFWHQIPIYPNLGERTYTKYLKYRKDRDTKYQMY